MKPNDAELKAMFEAISLPDGIFAFEETYQGEKVVVQLDFTDCNAWHLLRQHMTTTSIWKKLQNPLGTGAKTKEEWLEIMAVPIIVKTAFDPDRTRGGNQTSGLDKDMAKANKIEDEVKRQSAVDKIKADYLKYFPELKK